MASSRSPIIVVLTIVACAAAAPSQIRVGNSRFNAEVYSRPEFEEAIARNYAPLGDPELRNAENFIGANLRQLQRKSLDSLSGVTFGYNKKSDLNAVNGANRKMPYWTYEIPDFGKRNFDEIDRTNLDSFVKRDLNGGNRKFLVETRNFDEIDRTGFGGGDFHERQIGPGRPANR